MIPERMIKNLFDDCMTFMKPYDFIVDKKSYRVPANLKLVLNNSKKCAGMCWSNHIINISKRFLVAESTTFELCKDTLLHEIAHAIAGVENDHNHVWKNICTQIGCTGEVYCERFEKFKYKIKCMEGCLYGRYHMHPHHKNGIPTCRTHNKTPVYVRKIGSKEKLWESPAHKKAIDIYKEKLKYNVRCPKGCSYSQSKITKTLVPKCRRHKKIPVHVLCRKSQTPVWFSDKHMEKISNAIKDEMSTIY